MSQLLIAYWISTGIGFLFIVGSAAMGHLHGSEDVEADGSDPGDVDADGGDPGDVDAEGGDPGDVDGSADGADADGSDPGDVDPSASGSAHSNAAAGARVALVKDATVGVIAAKQQDRSLNFFLKLIGLLSPTKLALFMFFAGAVGVLTLHSFPGIGHLSLIPALLFGYVFRRVLLNMLGKLFSNLHSSTNFKQDSLIGSVGELILSIEPGRTGEIMVSTRGSRHNAPARASDPGVAIKNLSKVIINDYRDGVFYVEQMPNDTE